MWKLKSLTVAVFVVGLSMLGLVFGLARAQDEPYAPASLPAPATRPSPYDKDSKPINRITWTKGVFVRVSPDGSQLNALSILTGKAAPAPAAGRPFALDRAMLSDNIVLYPADHAVLAFGARPGTWAELPIPDGARVNVSFVALDIAVVTLNDDLYVYSAASGAWVGPMP